jgi:hypothetical protein
MGESKLNQSVSFVNLFRTCHDSSAFLFINTAMKVDLICVTQAPQQLFSVY